ncbi:MULTISPECIES: hydroxyisourate hydrolase [Catellatospora]|jgi:hydroxyisourate hydrolase|uniref:5-hydroxyisourate hydrolase n=2 Tax=Catellatospora TaxID=53365 RepID=A0A8J3KVR0_9ACTN|nr:hydroxyisourate hydrolase [Catellatospora coxensis]GIG07063.1 5-hydroxyisourate hydrolase [Catellatospora coxensis]
MTLSTHVLDTCRGEPAADVQVTLQRMGQYGWVVVATGTTNADGRLADWVPAEQWLVGRYGLRFDVAAYQGLGSFFPEVTVVFDVTDTTRHLHVPLLLSKFGYTTYRGS